MTGADMTEHAAYYVNTGGRIKCRCGWKATTEPADDIDTFGEHRAAAEREACRQEIERLRDEVAALTFQVQATATDPSQVVPLAFGRVRDAGGGEVHVVVDRATQTYPYVGAAVAIVMALGMAGRYDEPGAIPAATGPVEPPPEPPPLMDVLGAAVERARAERRASEEVDG